MPDSLQGFGAWHSQLPHKAEDCCPDGHRLKQHITPDGDGSYICDVCACVLGSGAVMYGCRTCDWDACLWCNAPRKSVETDESDKDATMIGRRPKDIKVPF